MRKEIILHLTRWFKKNARSLPWRENPDPYWVWISEIMLQQTQVTTVLPYFDRFMKRFPTVLDLAKAPLDDVFKLWAGLGYYSRARNLHKGAQAIAERIHQGQGFPSTRQAWLEIPGVGDYTAGAVSSIALNQREPIVDGNVERVLSRINAWTKRDPKKLQVWVEAKALVEEKSAVPRILNQALMELGALVCRPKSPDCARCPVNTECKGKKNPELYPEPKAKTKWKAVSEEKWVLTRKKNNHSEIYLEQNQDGAWRKGLWDFPVSLDQKVLPSAVLKTEFQIKYVVTNHKVLRNHRVFLVKSAPGAGAWFSIDALPGLPAPANKAVVHLKKLGLIE